MITLMRISQYFYNKSISTNKLKKVIYGDLANYFHRKNQIKNGLSCSKNPKFKKGIVFHHTNVIITEETVIEENVHIYGNVTFGIKDDNIFSLTRLIAYLSTKNSFLGLGSPVVLSKEVHSGVQ